MRQTTQLTAVALFTVGSAMCAPAQAQLVDIRIDLSTFLSSTPGNWNNISNLIGLTTGLIDFDTGAATFVSIDGTGSPWSDFFGDNDGAFPNQDWLIQPATVDGAGLLTGLTGTFTLGGLSDARPAHGRHAPGHRRRHPRRLDRGPGIVDPALRHHALESPGMGVRPGGKEGVRGLQQVPERSAHPSVLNAGGRWCSGSERIFRAGARRQYRTAPPSPPPRCRRGPSRPRR